MTILSTIATNPFLIYYLLLIAWSSATLFGLAVYIRKNRRLFK